MSDCLSEDEDTFDKLLSRDPLEITPEEETYHAENDEIDDPLSLGDVLDIKDSGTQNNIE
jgi:hypothetical protein